MSVGIHHLPTSTQARLRSSQILTSLPQLVSELAQNSLDAGARRIEVGVDCDEWACWVRDDGCGMSKTDLDALLNTGRYSEPFIDNSAHHACNSGGVVTCRYI